MRSIAFQTLRDGICTDVGHDGETDTGYLATVTSFLNQALDYAYGWLIEGWPELKVASSETVTSQVINLDTLNGGANYFGTLSVLRVTTNHPHTNINPKPVEWEITAAGIVVRGSTATSLYVEHIPAPPVYVNTAWATATAYAVGTMVLQNGYGYVCSTAHTSGTFATDLAASKWVVQNIPAFLNLPLRSAVAAALTGLAGQTQTQLQLIQGRLDVLLSAVAGRYENTSRSAPATA